MLPLELCHDDACTCNYSKLLWEIFPNDKLFCSDSTKAQVQFGNRGSELS